MHSKSLQQSQRCRPALQSQEFDTTSRQANLPPPGKSNTSTGTSSPITTSRPLANQSPKTCVGGSACPNGKPLYQIDVMRCKNSGSEYDPEDIQWTCQASLPPEIKLGGTEVVCEGYDSSEDPYVLKGSCGVEYRLVLTQAGEEIYRGKSSWTQRGSGDSYRPRSSETSLWKTATDSFFTLMFWAVFAGKL